MPNNTLTADFRMQAEAIEKLKQVTQGLGDAVRQVARDFQGVFAGMSQGTTPIPAPGVPLQFSTPTASSFYNSPATLAYIDTNKFASFIQNPAANISALSGQQQAIIERTRQVYAQNAANAKMVGDIGLARETKAIVPGISAFMSYLDMMKQPGMRRSHAIASLSPDAVSSLSTMTNPFEEGAFEFKEFETVQRRVRPQFETSRQADASNLAQSIKGLTEGRRAEVLNRPAFFSPAQRMAAERDALLSGDRSLAYDMLDVRRIEKMDVSGVMSQANRFISANQMSGDTTTQNLINALKELQKSLDGATKTQNESMQKIKELTIAGKHEELAKEQQAAIKTAASKEALAEEIADKIARHGGPGSGGGGGGGRFNIDTAKLSRWMQYGQGAAAAVSGIAGSVASVAEMYYNPLIEAEYKELGSYASIGERQAGRMSELLNLRDPYTQLKYAPKSFLSSADTSGVMAKYMEPGAIEGMISRRLENTITRDRYVKVAKAIEGTASALVASGEIVGGVAAMGTPGGQGTGSIAIAHGASNLSRAMTQIIQTRDMGLLNKLEGGLANDPTIAAGERAAFMSALFQEMDQAQSDIAKTYASKQIFMKHRTNLYDVEREGIRKYGRSAYGATDIYKSYFNDPALQGVAMEFGLTPAEAVGTLNTLSPAFGQGVTTSNLQQMLGFSRSGYGSLSDLSGNIQQMRLLTGGAGNIGQLKDVLTDAVAAGFDKAGRPQEFVNSVLALAKKLDVTDPTVLSKSLAVYGMLTGGSVDSRTLGQVTKGVQTYQEATGESSGLSGMLKASKLLGSGVSPKDLSLYIDMTSAQASGYISQLKKAGNITDIKDLNLLSLLGGDIGNKDKVISQLETIEAAEYTNIYGQTGFNWGDGGDVLADLRAFKDEDWKNPEAVTKMLGSTLRKLQSGYGMTRGKMGKQMGIGQLTAEIKKRIPPEYQAKMQQELDILKTGTANEDIGQSETIHTGMEAPGAADYDRIGSFLKKYNRPLTTDTGQIINVGDYEAYIETRQTAYQQQKREEGVVSEHYTKLIMDLEAKFATLSNVNLGTQELAAQSQAEATNNIQSQLTYLKDIADNTRAIQNALESDRKPFDRSLNILDWEANRILR